MTAYTKDELAKLKKYGVRYPCNARDALRLIARMEELEKQLEDAYYNDYD